MRGFLAKACGLLVSTVWIGAALPALAQEMTFKVLTDRAGCGTCIWAQASGEITTATSASFKTFLQQNPFIAVVQIDSAGGNLGAALEMGELVRSRNLSMVVGSASVRPTSSGDQIATRVAGQCMSACVFVLAAGQERSQVAGSVIGVHQFSGGTDGINGAQGLDVGQRVAGSLITYLTRMGVNPTMISAASTASPDDIHVLTNDEALRLKLLTSVQHQYSTATAKVAIGVNSADPFGDNDRIPPASRAHCAVPYYSDPEGRFSTKELQQANRWYRDVCEHYFYVMEGLNECRAVWDAAQQAINNVTYQFTKAKPERFLSISPVMYVQSSMSTEAAICALRRR